MRAWMMDRRMPFTTAALCEGLNADTVKEKDKIRNTLIDFIHRGEITLMPLKQNRRQKYRYNRTWKPKKKGVSNKTIFKAMYVSSTFTAADIERLSGSGRSHINKNIRNLARRGLLVKVGRRLCGHGAGAEAIYRIADRETFRIEVM